MARSHACPQVKITFWKGDKFTVDSEDGEVPEARDVGDPVNKAFIQAIHDGSGSVQRRLGLDEGSLPVVLQTSTSRTAAVWVRHPCGAANADVRRVRACCPDSQELCRRRVPVWIA